MNENQQRLSKTEMTEKLFQSDPANIENPNQSEAKEILAPEEKVQTQKVRIQVETLTRHEAVLTSELEMIAKQFTGWARGGDFPQGGLVDRALNESETIDSVKRDLKAYNEAAYSIKELTGRMEGASADQLTVAVGQLNEQIGMLNTAANRAKNDLENLSNWVYATGHKVKELLDNKWSSRG